MAKKFIIVDAHSIIFRSYFAFIKNPLKNARGENTSGVYGFVNMIEKMKKKLPSEYIGLAFDAPGDTFRDKVFKDYKATRPPPPPDIPFQIEKAKEISACLGIPQFEVEGYEADDILATLAIKLKEHGDVYIATSDKDLLQMVSENVYVYDAYRDEILDRDKVYAKLGIPPEKVPMYLALVGDTIDNVPGVKEKIARGKVLMGTIDVWLMWKLSGGRYHVTDFSNASRTLLLNIHTLSWDPELLQMLDIPESILPELKPSSGVLAVSAKEVFFGQEVPIAGVAGDQHAATFGQTCFKPGMVKNTYGTALALFMNIGEKAVLSDNGLTTNLGWNVGGTTEYALEGVVFIGGAAIQWLRDELKIIGSAEECSVLAEKVPDTGGVYMVPAFTGLCAPYWDMYARGLIIGITRGTSQAHIARSALESIAYQTRDVMDSMVRDFGKEATSLRVDGGGTKSDFLMQFQADILGIPVERPRVTEMAARGAAYLAGLGVGFWKSKDEIAKQWKLDKVFEPNLGKDRRDSLYAGWQKAVTRSLDWAPRD